jgi:large subunit ribosomal protein L24
MRKSKIVKGHLVSVIAGKDKGRVGMVLSLVNDGMKVLVQGANLVKRHLKANPSQEKAGGIIEKEAPIHISNVAIFNEATGKPDRIGFKLLNDGTKVRIFKSTGEIVEVNKTAG